MALIAVIFGGGTTISYQNLFPESVRPDPWTSTQAHIAHAELADKIIAANEQSQDRHDAQDVRLDALESAQVLDNAHRAKSEDGWRMLYEVHEELAVIRERLRKNGRSQ